MDSTGRATVLLDADTLIAWRNRAVHFGDFSGLHKLRESQRTLVANYRAVDASYCLNAELLAWCVDKERLSPPTGRFVNTLEPKCARITGFNPTDCLEYLDNVNFATGFDFEKEAERIRDKYSPLLAARLVALLRLGFLRKHFEWLLRLVRKVIAVVIRIPRQHPFLSSIIVRQAAFFQIHGEHPPRNTAPDVIGSVFRAGGCTA